jgi:predicted TIM-barrel fold metal-dependent hydrolase
MNRREILGLALGAGAVSLARSAASDEPGSESHESFEIVDSHVGLFHWPFRRLPLDCTDALVRKLGSLAIREAWAGSFDGLLHRDVRQVNERLAEECRKYPMLVPIGSVNLELPGWETELARCAENHRMPGIRLHPNYHGYTLSDSRFDRLLEVATSAGLFVQIATSMEDTRTQHSLVAVPDVDVSPLLELLPRIVGARVQLLNHRLRGTLAEELGKTPGISFDTARIDGTAAVPTLAAGVSAGRVLFGSHAPFLIPEAALIRTHESGAGSVADLRFVLAGNANLLRAS